MPGRYSSWTTSSPAVWRPSTGAFYYFQSNDFVPLSHAWVGVPGFGGTVVVADFNADGIDDPAYFHPPTGEGWIHDLLSGSLTFAPSGATASDVLVPRDYDGDGFAELAYWRRSTGEWINEGPLHARRYVVEAVIGSSFGTPAPPR